MNFDPQLLFGIASGIGLSAACGFRVFVPLLVASIAHKMGGLPLAENLEWLSSWPALIAFATASVLEITAYYIPYVDNLLDTIATPSAMIAGTLVSASTIVSIDPTWQWILALLVGGGSAGIIQAGTGLTRLSSLKFTGGLGNHVVATGENVASIGGSIMAIVTPLLALAGVAILVIIILWLISKFFIKRLKVSKTAT
jgi:hypothetical protein